MKPAILRVALVPFHSAHFPTGLCTPLSSSANLTASTNLTSSTTNIPIVYVSGRAFIPSTVVKPKQYNYGPKKISTEDSVEIKQSVISLDDSVQCKPQPILSSNYPYQPKTTSFISYIESESFPSVLPSSVKPSPLVVVVNTDSKTQTLAELTASIAESISNMVLESSNSVLINSAAVSDAIMRDTQAIANSIGLSNSEVSADISSRTRVISANSVATGQESAIRNLATISRQTQEASSSASASTMCSVNQISSETLDSVSPISKQTRDLQHAATVGLEEGLNKEVDDVVRSIMMATSTAHKES